MDFSEYDKLTEEGFLRKVISPCGDLVLYNYTDKCTYEKHKTIGEYIMKKLILFAVIFLFCLFTIPKLIEMQKENNYKRCESVVYAAIATGKLPSDTDVHEKCAYHLSFYIKNTIRKPSSIEEGKKIYGKCYSCHGHQAEGNSGMGAPALAGQHSWYLTKQIEYIRDGKRTSGRSSMMRGIFKKLSEDDIENVSKYLRSLGKCK